ncbi:MAG TPA: vanadium-dependent haloperoxidase [Thermoanaerobaculia bacterium]
MTHEPRDGEGAAALSRRRFLGGVGGAAAAAVAASALPFEPLLGKAAAAETVPIEQGGPSTGSSRVEQAFQIRLDAAQAERARPVEAHVTNGDEERWPNRIGNYHKSLPHNQFGEVDPAAWAAMKKALGSGDPDDFDAIPIGGPNRLTNPQSGLAFDLQGVDGHCLAIPPAPALSSAREAAEAVELYWMSLLRDVNFLDYESSDLVAQAAAELSRLPEYRGLRVNGQVTPRMLFRDPIVGTRTGPLISQFLWRGTPYGAEYVQRHIRTVLPGQDHATQYEDWLRLQNGQLTSDRGFHDPVRRYIRNGRDIAEWVHVDELFQAYLNACLILVQPPDPMDGVTGGGIACPTNPGNPYKHSKNQIGFATFGAPHFKTLMCEVATRALKATWFQKWFVHRRLRPEAFGGLVHHQRTSNRYPGVLHDDILSSQAVDAVFSKFGTYLLPQAFPEGCPTHPAYSAGHATVGGACVTILKALFDERFELRTAFVPSADGLTLERYDGPPLTVGGELNKLASNIATSRNMAGVHWRTDAIESLRLGERIAISVLQDQKACYGERFSGFTFTLFDGTSVTV